MAHFDGPAVVHQETETAEMAARNSRNGLILFFVYLVLYAGFVGLTAFGMSFMKQEIAGVNLAIWYGLLLIIAAFVLSLVYLWLCKVPQPASEPTK